MRERKYIKLRIDMYEDTKFKIIDMKPERDLIHYVWTRFVALAGKCNLEGALYMSKNIPYTIETLAIEFNRYINQIKLAVDIFIELEMLEITEDNVYRVKNFAKHQNIKVKENVENSDRKEVTNIKEIKVKENFINEVYDNAEICDNEGEKDQDKACENIVANVKINKVYNLEVENRVVGKATKQDIIKNKKKDIGKNHNRDIGAINNKFQDNQDNTPRVLEENMNKKAHKSKSREKRNNNIDDIIEEENNLIQFYDGDALRPLQEDECVIGEWTF